MSALADGFASLGIPSEIISPKAVFSRVRDLRDESILKLLSTSAIFAAPVAKRAICIAHGIPCVDVQGWPTVAGLIAGFKAANRGRVPVVAVSDYIAVHLQYMFNIQMAAAIRNPLKPIYLQPIDGTASERPYITYIGRLHPAKNIHLILPAICDLLEENPELRACIIGAGEMRPHLEAIANGNPRVEFKGAPDDAEVRDWLRKTRLFVSGNQAEGLGVTYLEALSQGSCVAMPASGGGIEIARELIGDSVFLLPLTMARREILEVLRRGIHGTASSLPLHPYEPVEVAKAYLAVDARRGTSSGVFTTRRVNAAARS
jgi:glycosyltransferase involved in cell wall biosynthesis